jgi:hypothetical protein
MTERVQSGCTSPIFDEFIRFNTALADRAVA